MKLGIHFVKGTTSDSKDSFNWRWIKYCQENNIEYKLVDAYKSDIIKQIFDCDAFLWHFYQASIKDFLFAKELIFSIDAVGKKTFPSVNMTWHFDDKVAQKYLLEGIHAPLVDSFVFYDKNDVLEWSENIELPIVFKLRGGSSSQNVKLLKTRNEVIKHINRAFGRGFSQYNAHAVFKDRVQKFVKRRGSLSGVLKGFIRLFFHTKYSNVRGRDKGYIYFQKYIPNNDSDIRIIVVGARAFAIKRMVRENDFRASGGGVILYEKSEIDIEAVKIAFEVSKKLELECVAFDFVFDEKTNPLIIEISFGFAVEAYDSCPGYWDVKLNWHEGTFNPQAWMIEDLINKLKHK